MLGSSGSGKTTVAKRLGRLLDLPILELDSVMHLEGWQPRPEEEFRTIVSEFAQGDSWVIDGSYTSLGTDGYVWPRTDTFVWLDPPRSTVMVRVVSRTLRRAITREELWNGNREPMTNFYRWDPEVNIIRWAWTRYYPTKQKLEQSMASGEWDHAVVHRLQNTAQLEALFHEIEQSIRH